MSDVLNFRRGYSKCFLGQIHYREHGSGQPVLCLHQSPQSSSMFDTVLPLLGKHVRAIAMDTIGYGMSDNPGRMVEPEEYGRTILEFLDDLGLTKPIPIIGVPLAPTSPHNSRCRRRNESLKSSSRDRCCCIRKAPRCRCARRPPFRAQTAAT